MTTFTKYVDRPFRRGYTIHKVMSAVEEGACAGCGYPIYVGDYWYVETDTEECCCSADCATSVRSAAIKKWKEEGGDFNDN